MKASTSWPPEFIRTREDWKAFSCISTSSCLVSLVPGVLQSVPVCHSPLAIR